MSLDITLYNNCCEKCGRGDEVYSANITHNLTTMAKYAGIYDVIWHPEDIAKTARDIIPDLSHGFNKLKTFPERYIKYEPTNGWGTYKGFIDFVEKYLEACTKYPESIIEVSR